MESPVGWAGLGDGLELDGVEQIDEADESLSLPESVPVGEPLTNEKIMSLVSPPRIYRNTPFFCAIYTTAVLALVSVSLGNGSTGTHQTHPFRGQVTGTKELNAMSLADLCVAITTEFQEWSRLFSSGTFPAAQGNLSVGVFQAELHQAALVPMVAHTSKMLLLAEGHGVTEAWLARTIRDPTNYVSEVLFVALAEEVRQRVQQVSHLALQDVSDAGIDGESVKNNRHLHVHQLAAFFLCQARQQVVHLLHSTAPGDVIGAYHRLLSSLELASITVDRHPAIVAAYSAAAANGAAAAAVANLGRPDTSDAGVVAGISVRSADMWESMMVDFQHTTREGVRSFERCRQRHIGKWFAVAIIAIAILGLAGRMLLEFRSRCAYEDKLRLDFFKVEDTSNVIRTYCETLEGWKIGKTLTADKPLEESMQSGNDADRSTGSGRESGKESGKESANEQDECPTGDAEEPDLNEEAPQGDCQMEGYLKRAVLILRHLRPFVPGWIFSSGDSGGEAVPTTPNSKLSKGSKAPAGARPGPSDPFLGVLDLMGGGGVGGELARSQSCGSMASSVRSEVLQSPTGSRSSICSTSVSADALCPLTTANHLELGLGLRTSTDTLLLVSTRFLGAGPDMSSSSSMSLRQMSDIPTATDAQFASFLQEAAFIIETAGSGKMLDVTPLYVVASFASELSACKAALKLESRLQETDPEFAPSMSIAKGRMLKGVVTTGMHKCMLLGGVPMKNLLKLERLNGILDTTILTSMVLSKTMITAVMRGVRLDPVGVFMSCSGGVVSLQVASAVCRKNQGKGAEAEPEEAASQRKAHHKVFNYIKKAQYELARNNLDSYVETYEGGEPSVRSAYLNKMLNIKLKRKPSKI